MASNASAALRRAAGSVLIAGLEGTTLSTMETAWLKLIRPSGVILFRRNIEDARGTHALLKAAQSATGSPILRCVDVEGGTVDRLRDLIAPMPSTHAVAATGATKLFATHGRLIGKEVRLLGFNATFAPVVDLKTESSAKVMTSRVASNDPIEVTRYAKHFLAGLKREKVLSCGKHFPGLGSGQVDSHHSTPHIDKAFRSLWETDLLPYRSLVSDLDLVMISHASYPQTLSRREPASISRFWTTAVLTKQIGFRGLIVSDDMAMGGILSYTSLADAVVRAISAGTHLIEICRDAALVFTAYEALLAEAERSQSFARRLRAAAQAIERFKHRRVAWSGFAPPPTAQKFERIRNEILNFTAKVTRSGDRQ